jgi:PIN domain nuclease of toxin-antitoxin system
VSVVFDAWALLAYLRDEPAAERVERQLLGGPSVISSVNFGEVLYRTIREWGEHEALAAADTLRSTVVVEHPDLPLVTAAARLKARGGISYADAFCVATAQRHRLPVWTGDSEILGLDEPGVELVDLRTAP